MGKSKISKKRPSDIKKTIPELQVSRDGGQIALRGFSYQFLYSCFLILSSTNDDISFQLEGVEDIDRIECKNGADNFTHIQLKYSINKQNASFMPDILENFLEVYLLDQNRDFKLVYDFPVAKGNMSKLFQSVLDANSRQHWSNVIEKIKNKHPLWNWSVYNLDSFLAKLSFEKIEKSTLATEIEKLLIEKYEITTDNISLFANSIKVLCFERMEQRAFVYKQDIDHCIQSVKVDISKGIQNPAHSWIRRLNYSTPSCYNKHDFFEGKKATPADIASGLPIRRPTLEQETIDSIHNNTITVIKSSSGQGKTTLALQVAYTLQNEYTPYQLTWCNEIQELGNITQYFKSRIQLGEKLLIIIDNLDSHLSKWNKLAQLMQSELPCHYKVLITSREIDWYNYSGDLSNVQALKIVKPILKEKEALEIFNILKKNKQLHYSITGWQKAWNKIAERKLLIEYVYLLTHGEMLSERISSQISEISKSPAGKAKCELLRKICFADVCGIKVPTSSLFESQAEHTDEDFGELLKSMESEFLVHTNTDGEYVEGLHPVRSKHIMDRLHEFFPIDYTALAIIEIAQPEDLAILFSHLPEFNLNKNEFCNRAVDKLWKRNELSNYISAIKGLFSGSVMQYYHKNKVAFDDANSHGGLFFISTEMCPFVKFDEFGISINTLDKMRDILPQNKNIEYLCNLREIFSIYDLHDTLIYFFCGCLYRKLVQVNFSDIHDIESYATVAELIYNIDFSFNLSLNFSLESIWKKSEQISLNCISTLMYISFCGNKSAYMDYVENNLSHILTYLKHRTKSHRIFVDIKKNAIHVEYLLRLCDIKSGNEASVSRLKNICKTLPIFDSYCADAIKPTINTLSNYTVPDDAHKEMPINNLVIMFHQDLTSLWNKTIMSNYEFDTVIEWLEYWFDVRKSICLLVDKCCACIYKLLCGKPLGSLAKEVDVLREQFSLKTTGEKRYPKEDRPFEEKATIPEGIGKIRNNYIQSISNFFNQFPLFLTGNKENQRLSLVNLKTAQSELTEMQNYFEDIAIEFSAQDRHFNLCDMESKNIESLIMCCYYYKTHTANKYFNKYQIREWYEANCRNERKIAEEGFSQLQSRYSIHFPNKIYNMKMLSCYPIIIGNIGMSTEGCLEEWLISCVAFAETSFDYLVVLWLNPSNKINPIALQFPRRMLVDIKKAIEEENYELLEKILCPYPVQVSKLMVDCFQENFSIQSEYISESNANQVADIAEELWAYSTLQELLAEDEDAEYLEAELKLIKSNVSRMLQLLHCKLPVKDIQKLGNTCSKVFNGEIFDNTSFNDLIENFIEKH